MWLLQRLFGSLYSIDSIVMDALNFGGIARRCRRYSVLTLDTVCRLTTILANCEALLGRTLGSGCTVDDYFRLASPTELQVELQWASSRKT